MAAENVLRSFLVKLGFKVDDQQFRNFQERLDKTSKATISLTKGFADLASKSVIAGTAMGATIIRASSALEGLYYASQRTGASAKQLQVLSFAASQIGVSAEQARSAIESLAQTRALDPGANGLLAKLGINPAQTNNAIVFGQVLQRLHNMPLFQGAGYAKMLGIDPATFRQMELNLPQMMKAAQARQATLNREGIDPDRLASDAHKAQLELRTMESQLMDLVYRFSDRMFPVFERWIADVDKFADFAFKADKATHGWSTKIGGTAAFFGGTAVTGWIAKKLFGLVGRGGGAAAGEAAAGAEGAAAAGAEGAGAGMLGVVALPAIIIAAVSAALVWMSLHPDKVRKAAAAVWHAGVNEARALPHQISSAAHKVSSAAHAMGWKNFLDTIAGTVAPGLTGFVSTLAGKTSNFIANYEGILRKATWDYKGYSIGYGHQIQPGEHFSGSISNANALKLLRSDTAKAMQAVLSLVKVKLNSNQLEALTDFDYNVGKSAFAHSTLLKMLNRGDYIGAAAQFAHWNKVLVNGHYEVNSGLAKRRAAEARLFGTPDKSLALHQETNIYVDGSKDPKATGAEVARLQGRTNGDLVRNFEGAVR